MTPQQEEVSNVLRTVLDPEIGIDIISLGLVYASGIEDDRVDVVMTLTMTLTLPGCPMHATIAGDAQAAIRSLDWVREVEMRITFEPRWTPERLSPEARLALRR
jgi:metal-sulfur cluster biosynthetic enzyme